MNEHVKYSITPGVGENYLINFFTFLGLTNYATTTKLSLGWQGYGENINEKWIGKATGKKLKETNQNWSKSM